MRGVAAVPGRVYVIAYFSMVRLQVWNTNGVDGVHRFLARSWRLFEGGVSTNAKPTTEQLRAVHTAIKKVKIRYQLA